MNEAASRGGEGVFICLKEVRWVIPIDVASAARVLLQHLGYGFAHHLTAIGTSRGKRIALSFVAKCLSSRSEGCPSSFQAEENLAHHHSQTLGIAECRVTCNGSCKLYFTIYSSSSLSGIFLSHSSLAMMRPRQFPSLSPCIPEFCST